MEKTIKIGEQEIRLKATAATPLHYRNVFKGHDLMKDLMKIGECDENLENIDLGIFERMVYIMSGAFKTESLADWLDKFEMTDIVEAIPEIIDLWGDNAETQSLDNSKNVGTTENLPQASLY